MKIRIAANEQDRDACFAVREAVFMNEQGVTESEEWDGHDDSCIHFLAGNTTAPAGCARLMPKGDTAKVQRVAVMPEHRGTGLGRLIMLAVLDHAREAGFARIILDSQTHAVAFYERLGFTAYGPEFDDAGIPHRSMRLSLT